MKKITFHAHAYNHIVNKMMAQSCVIINGGPALTSVFLKSCYHSFFFFN